MEKKMIEALARPLADFHLPHYAALPNMGLYLEQCTVYINQLLAPLGCGELTGSMIRNYVKKGLIANPVKKGYYADQIAHLIVLTLLKQVLPLEHIQDLFAHYIGQYTTEVAYDYFCMELENILRYQFGLSQEILHIGSTHSVIKQMLRSAIGAVCSVIFLSAHFRMLKQTQWKSTES